MLLSVTTVLIMCVGLSCVNATPVIQRDLAQCSNACAYLPTDATQSSNWRCCSASVDSCATLWDRDGSNLSNYKNAGWDECGVSVYHNSPGSCHDELRKRDDSTFRGCMNTAFDQSICFDGDTQVVGGDGAIYNAAMVYEDEGPVNYTTLDGYVKVAYRLESADDSELVKRWNPSRTVKKPCAANFAAQLSSCIQNCRSLQRYQLPVKWYTDLFRTVGSAACEAMCYQQWRR